MFIGSSQTATHPSILKAKHVQDANEPIHGISNCIVEHSHCFVRFATCRTNAGWSMVTSRFDLIVNRFIAFRTGGSTGGAQSFGRIGSSYDGCNRADVQRLGQRVTHCLGLDR